jgi:carboxypeptidase Q
VSWSFSDTPAGNAGGTDGAVFTCYGTPSFGLGALDWNYGSYTWHTNRDTYDKVVFDDLKNNATMAAMLAYAASEDQEKTSREVSTLPPLPNGQARPWPKCGKARRSFAEPPGRIQ